MIIKEKLKSKIVARLADAPATEACGLIVDDPPKFVPCENVLAPAARRLGFQIPARDFKLSTDAGVKRG